jgi:LacI family transcriptional regulator
MSATLKQLAEHTGLSVTTVSEILNATARNYKAATRRRVIDAARSLGYRPNHFARSIKSGRFGTIALLVSSNDERSNLPKSLLHAIKEELTRRELLLLLGSVTDQQVQAHHTLPRILRTWAADGLLINYISGVPQQLEEFVNRQNFPAVWLNSKHGRDCIYPDDEGAAVEATEYLLKLGHRRVAFVNYNFGTHSTPVHYSSPDRYAGYSRAMSATGLPPVNISAGDAVPLGDRLAYSRRWLAAAARPTAVLCYAPETAVPVYIAARSLGLEVPRDLSIIHFDDHVTDEHGTKLDTLLLPEQAMGRLAIEQLMKKIQTPGHTFPAKALPAKLATGWTTAPPLS